MINDAYVEHNKTKKQAWLIIPLALIIIGLIIVFGNHDDDGLFPNKQPSVISSSPQGMLIELPTVAVQEAINWQPEWLLASNLARQQVLQSLSQYAADYQQLRLRLEVWAKPGATERTKLAQRIGKALAHYDLGQVNQSANPPAAIVTGDDAVVLLCAEADRELAIRLLAALSPYLSGKVSLRFEPEIRPQTMRLYLLGTPYFNTYGQATFDQVIVKSAPKNTDH